MRTAVLEQTRHFFGLVDGSSFTAIRDAVHPLVRSVKEIGNKNDSQSPKPPRKSAYILMSAALVPAALGVAFDPWRTSHNDSVAAELEPHLREKSVYIVQPTHVPTADLTLPATFRPWQVATLNARVSGYVVAWHSDLGDIVRAGDLLAEIETPELDQELATSEAQIREVLAATAQARAERVEAEADLKVAEAQLARVQSEISLAKSQLVRRRELLAKNVVSREEFDSFATVVETRTAEVAAVEADIARRQTNLETRAAVIDAREANANSRLSNRNRLFELQAFKRVVAPFDGVVTRRTVENGQLVTAGQGGLFVLEDHSRIRVQMAVPQTFAAHTPVGTIASIRIPESNLSNIQGTVTRVAESVDSSSRTMLAEIELDNELRAFQSGVYAQVTLKATHDIQAWSVPANTVAMRVDGPHVAVVDDSNQIEMRRVRLGRDLARVVVTDGIQGYERSVINPGVDLLNGQDIVVNSNQAGATSEK